MMHIDEVKAWAQRAHSDGAERERLFCSMIAGDGREAYYSAWVLTHLPSSDNRYIDSHRGELVQLAVSTGDISLCRLSLTLLERLDWRTEDVRTDLLDFCLEHIMLSDVPSGVRSLCVKLAYMQCRHYPELKEELRQSLLLIEPSGLCAGVKHVRGKILKRLA